MGQSAVAVIRSDLLLTLIVDSCCVVIESSFDPGEQLQTPGSLWSFPSVGSQHFFLVSQWRQNLIVR
jgi:hypothetical protein